MAPDPNQSFKGKSSPVEDESVFQNLSVVTNSSSEEENEIENNGYEPLSQDPDGLEEDQIDYSSLSGIMNALNTYGTQYISDIDEDNNQSQLQEVLPCFNDASLSNFAPEFNVTASNFEARQIVIDKEKEEEIKNVMSKITLPTSAIPLWANQLSDEEWKSHVNSIIHGSAKQNYKMDMEFSCNINGLSQKTDLD